TGQGVVCGSLFFAWTFSRNSVAACSRANALRVEAARRSAARWRALLPGFMFINALGISIFGFLRRPPFFTLAFLALVFLALVFVALAFLALAFLVLAFLVLAFLVLAFLALAFLVLAFLVLVFLVLVFLVLVFLVLVF